MPQPRRLLVQRLDEMRMGMTERIHRNARAEIEILAPIFGGQSRPFAGDERHRMPVVDCRRDGLMVLATLVAKSEKPPAVRRRSVLYV